MPDIAVDSVRFRTVCQATLTAEHAREGIGTYKEKKLHRILKEYFAVDPTCLEIPLDGYVADICNPSEIIEIQTSGLTRMRDKLEVFLANHPLTVVFPVAETKWVSWIEPETGNVVSRRKSSRHGEICDVLPELIYILDYLGHPNLTLRVVSLSVEEYRLLDGRRSADRKRGASLYERIPTDICRMYDCKTVADYKEIFPFHSGELFTSAELGRRLHIRSRRISAVIRVMMSLGVIARLGKEGRFYQYVVV